MKRLLPIVLVAIGATGCRDITALLTTPFPFAGTYALRTVNGLGVPAPVVTVRDSCAWGIRAGTLRLAAGAFQLSLDDYRTPGCAHDTVVVGEIVVVVGRDDGELRVPPEVGGPLEVRGDLLALTAIDPARADGGTLTVAGRVSAGVVTLSFPAGALGLPVATTFGFVPLPGTR